jgi:hypothetical protein
VVALASPSFQLFMVPSSFLCHLKNVAIGLLVLAVEGMVLLLQALRLLGHFFHFFAECKEKVVAVVQSILDL